ncbi:site-specific integrase [Lysinibacillus capsici]|uniref:site-specific integrase n=1 Tax=Lysinibacillus capsici TaxID=2115968 RepID=UPI002E20C8B4|nr:site-specific integrase [Lysinibacillus capsici]
MLQSEIIEELKKPYKNKWNENLFSQTGMSRMQFIRYVEEVLKATWNESQNVWDINTNLIIEVEVEVFLKTYNNRLTVPVKHYQWNYDLNEEDIKYLKSTYELQINKTHEGVKPKRIELIYMYLFKVLRHPFDILFVTEEMIYDSLRINKESIYSILKWLKLIIISLALKNQIRIPYNISFKVFRDLPVSLYKNRGNETFRQRLSEESLLLLENGNIKINELEQFYDSEAANNRLTLNKSNNIIYIIVSIFLNKRINDFQILNIKNMGIDEWLEITSLVNQIYKPNNIPTTLYNTYFMILNMLFELIIGTRISLNTFFLQNIKLELSKALLNYKYSIVSSNGYIELYYGLNLILEMNNSVIKDINDLTVPNINQALKNYIDTSVKESKNIKTIRQKIHWFCQALIQIKELFGRENRLGVRYEFPYQFHEILSKEAFNVKTVLSDALNYVDSQLLEQTDGSYKEDIEVIDKIALAIKNYKFKYSYDRNKEQYFNELQCITALRILVETGIRLSEVINIPYHFIGRVEEEDIDIVVLSLNKLGEEFGVVPISKETANMLRRSLEIRKKDYPSSIVDMLLYDPNKNKKRFKYPLQFVYSSKVGNKFIRLSPNILEDFLNQICDEINVKRQKGKRFHMFRHRAAEYFFFCMSYYDEFDFKNDEEYKNEVVKKLLRHNDIEMTQSYTWGNLIDLIAEKKLVFLKSLPSLEKWSNKDKSIHYESVIKKLNEDLSNELTEYSVNNVVKLLTLPIGLIEESTLNSISKSRSFKTILKHLKRIDGEKGVVPNGLAYFGMCGQFSCPKLKQTAKITCTACESLILEKNRLPHLIGIIARCQEAIISLGSDYMGNHYAYNHLHSLRARSINAQAKIYEEYKLSPEEVVSLIAQYFEGKLKFEQ